MNTVHAGQNQVLISFISSSKSHCHDQRNFTHNIGLDPHEGFMNSAGHRQNILGENFKKVGLGFYQDGRYLYVTQWFTD